MVYRYCTEFFALTDDTISFLRNRFPYKVIKSNELIKVQLTKGTDVKRPIVSIGFGAILIGVSVFLIVNFSGFGFEDLEGGGFIRAVGYLIVLELFFAGLGGYSIYRALPVHKVIVFTMASGEQESFSISDAIQKKEVDLLVSCLVKLINKTGIEMDSDIERTLVTPVK